MADLERHSQNKLSPDIMSSLMHAIRTIPTAEEANKRRVYEADVGLAEGDRFININLDGRIVLPPDSYETVAEILDYVGFTEEQRDEVIAHKKEHIDEAEKSGVTVLDMIVNFVKTESGKATVNVEARMIAKSKDALKGAISAPEDLSSHDKDIIDRLNS